MASGIGQGTGLQGVTNPYITTNFSQTFIDTAAAVFMDDFFGSAVNSSIWTQTNVGTATSTITSGTGGFGALWLQTAAVNTQSSTLNFNGKALAACNSTKKSEMEFCSYLSSVTAVICRVGVYSGVNDYIYMEVDPVGRGNDHWWICRNNNTGATADDTGISASTTGGTRDCFKLVNNTTNSFTLYWKTSGYNFPLLWTTIGTYTTKFTTNACSPYIYLYTSENVNKSLIMEYYRLSILRAAP